MIRLVVRGLAMLFLKTIDAARLVVWLSLKAVDVIKLAVLLLKAIDVVRLVVRGLRCYC